jgi:hypothetical protein
VERNVRALEDLQEALAVGPDARQQTVEGHEPGLGRLNCEALWRSHSAAARTCTPP